MFSKNGKDDKRKRYEQICSTKQSILDRTIVFEGEIVSENRLLIYGKVTGTIKSSSVVEIDIGGEVRGEIKAKEVIVRGLFDGEVECDDLMVLSGGVLKGKTRARTLTVEPQSEFQAVSQVITKKNEENILAEVVEEDGLIEDEKKDQKSLESK